MDLARYLYPPVIKRKYIYYWVNLFNIHIEQKNEEYSHANDIKQQVTISMPFRQKYPLLLVTIACES